LPPEEIRTREVSAIAVRFELLVNGELPAATLPDPLASGAVAAGAIMVIDDTSVPELSQSILAFGRQTLEEQPEAVRRFLQAWELAVEELNGSPEKYGDLLIEVGRVPESIQGQYQMPPFPEAMVPSPAQLADVVQWSLDEGLIEDDIPYERMVDDSYLP
jgi:NitT/TauT family transport system substrate-binding protein